MDFIDSKLVYKTNNLIKKVKLDFMCFYMFCIRKPTVQYGLDRIVIIVICCVIPLPSFF